MKITYLIESVDSFGFWAYGYNKFKGWLYRAEFSSEEEAIEYAKKNNIGVFKITKVYDTK